MLRGSTRVAGVIGDPVRHSLSPLLHNAAFAALGLDWAFAAFPVRAGAGAAALDAMRALRLEGLNVTMPLKGEVADAVDRLAPSAAALRSVNTVVWVGTELVGESTDGPGLVAALRADEGFDPAGRRCLVLGSGGAARAAVHALAGAGAASVVVAARRPEAGAAVAALAGPVGAAGTSDTADGAELIVDATPVGMAGHHPAPAPPPPRPPFPPRVGGGEAPPLEAMSAALVAELARRAAVAKGADA